MEDESQSSLSTDSSDSLLASQDSVSNIRTLDEASIRTISSSQVVTNIASALKELVENSLDASASEITVTLVDFGLAELRCEDNGSGVPHESRDKLCLRHQTSKIRSFDDISHLDTMGFRGEALASLCIISNGLEIVTSCGDDGECLKFDGCGHLVSRCSHQRNRGTTIIAKQFLCQLPVRRQSLTQHKQRQIVETVQLLQPYVLLHPTCRFRLQHQKLIGSSSFDVLLKSSGDGNLLNSVISTFHCSTRSMFHVNFSVELPNNDKPQHGHSNTATASIDDLALHRFDRRASLSSSSSSAPSATQHCHITGYISYPPAASTAILDTSKSTSWHSSTERCLLFVQRRPLQHSTSSGARFLRYIVTLWQSLTAHKRKFPLLSLFLSFTTESNAPIDINVTADKRTILINHCDWIGAKFSVSLGERCTIQIHQLIIFWGVNSGVLEAESAHGIFRFSRAASREI